LPGQCVRNIPAHAGKTVKIIVISW